MEKAASRAQPIQAAMMVRPDRAQADQLANHQLARLDAGQHRFQQAVGTFLDHALQHHAAGDQRRRQQQIDQRQRHDRAHHHLAAAAARRRRGDRHRRLKILDARGGGGRYAVLRQQRHAQLVRALLLDQVDQAVAAPAIGPQPQRSARGHIDRHAPAGACPAAFRCRSPDRARWRGRKLRRLGPPAHPAARPRADRAAAGA